MSGPWSLPESGLNPLAARKLLPAWLPTGKCAEGQDQEWASKNEHSKWVVLLAGSLSQRFVTTTHPGLISCPGILTSRTPGSVQILLFALISCLPIYPVAAAWEYLCSQLLLDLGIPGLELATIPFNTYLLEALPLTLKTVFFQSCCYFHSQVAFSCWPELSPETCSFCCLSYPSRGGAVGQASSVCIHIYTHYTPFIRDSPWMQAHSPQKWDGMHSPPRHPGLQVGLCRWGATLQAFPCRLCLLSIKP